MTNMAIRLTEEEIHTACTEIAAQGERPTALTLLDKLGRGSLTTITKYLNSWNSSDEAKVMGVELLPVVVALPAELTKDGEGLIKKIWAIAKGLADEELDIQREALKQAEINNKAKVEEAFKFSEAQALKNERLEDTLAAVKTEAEQKHADYLTAMAQLNVAEKENVGLSKDNDQLNHEISELKAKITALEDLNKIILADKQALEEKQLVALKQKDKTIQSLELENHKIQLTLTSTLDSNTQLQADNQDKTIKHTDCALKLEKANHLYEASTTELTAVKTELKALSKTVLDTEKMVSNLQGKLEVYKSLDQAELETKKAIKK